MHGDYDKLLKWPFTYPLLLCLYDKSSKRDHIVRTLIPDINIECFQEPQMDENKSTDISQFGPICKLFDDQYGYIYQNKLMIKAIVNQQI